MPTIMQGHDKQSLPPPELIAELRRQISHQTVNIKGDKSWEKGKAGSGGERGRAG